MSLTALKNWMKYQERLARGLLKEFSDLFQDKTEIAEVRKRTLELVPFWVAAGATGAISVIYARSFHYAEQLSSRIFQEIGDWSFLFVPTGFVLAWLLVEKAAPFSNGSGIPQLMAASTVAPQESRESQSLIRRLLGFRVIIVKFLSSMLLVVSGGAIGREGPTLQIAGSVFYITSKVFPKQWLAKNLQGLLLAGGAAGLASAFNTPLGGIAYVVEELGKTHLNSFRTGMLHAVIVAGFIAQTLVGPYLYLGYPKFDSFQWPDIPWAIVLAILAAVIGTLFGQGLKAVFQWRSRITKLSQKILLAAGAGLLFCALIRFGSQEYRASGTELLNRLLFSSTDGSAEIVDVVGRFFGPLLSYMSGAAGGIFAPVLALGGTAGSAFANLFDVPMGGLAVLVGMTAALAALTHSPFTSFVLILEMTDRHSAIFPLMLAAVIGHGVSKMISRTSFYEFVAAKILAQHGFQEDETHAPSEKTK